MISNINLPTTRKDVALKERERILSFLNREIGIENTYGKDADWLKSLHYMMYCIEKGDHFNKEKDEY